MTSLDREEMLNEFRRAVLDALDKAALEHFGKANGGWHDRDLPALFKALDSHVDKLATRHGCDMNMPEAGQASPVYGQTRRWR